MLALPLATHTHFLLSLNWSTDPGGRRRRRREEEGRRREGGREGSGEAVPPGPSWKAFLGSQPPRRASQCGSRLPLPAWAGPSGSAGASRFRAPVWARGRSGYGRPPARGGPGPPPTCRCPPAARAWWSRNMAASALGGVAGCSPASPQPGRAPRTLGAAPGRRPPRSRPPLPGPAQVGAPGPPLGHFCILSRPYFDNAIRLEKYLASPLTPIQFWNVGYTQSWSETEEEEARSLVPAGRGGG